MTIMTSMTGVMPMWMTSTGISIYFIWNVTHISKIMFRTSMNSFLNRLFFRIWMNSVVNFHLVSAYFWMFELILFFLTFDLCFHLNKDQLLSSLLEEWLKAFEECTFEKPSVNVKKTTLHRELYLTCFNSSSGKNSFESSEKGRTNYKKLRFTFVMFLPVFFLIYLFF